MSLFACEKAEIEPKEDENGQNVEQNDTTTQFPNYEYYLDLYNVGEWELEIVESGEHEIGLIDWAERNLRNPDNVYKIPNDAPYMFDYNTGLRFIKL